MSKVRHGAVTLDYLGEPSDAKGPSKQDARGSKPEKGTWPEGQRLG